MAYGPSRIEFPVEGGATAKGKMTCGDGGGGCGHEEDWVAVAQGPGAWPVQGKGRRGAGRSWIAVHFHRLKLDPV